MTDARLNEEIRYFVESSEAELMRYGLFDVVTPVRDVLEFAEFSPELTEDLQQLTEAQRRERLLSGMEQLVGDEVFLRFDDGDVEDWRIRSRIGELVRLIVRLRQRFPYHPLFTASKGLVQDVHYEVRPRQYPERSHLRAEMLSRLLRAGKTGRVSKVELQQVQDLLEASGLPGTYSTFQMKAFERLGNWLFDGQSSESKGLVVGAGTGAGKTNTFFIPALAYAVLIKMIRKERGVKAVAIYPRQKLAQNQMETFLETLTLLNAAGGDKPGLTIALDYQGTLYRRSELDRAKIDKLEKKGWNKVRIGREEYLVFPAAKCPQPNCEGSLGVPVTNSHPQTPPLRCLRCGHQVPEVSYVREDWATNPPDFYIAVTESLNLRLLDSSFAFLFGEGTLTPHPDYPSARPSVPRLVMLDEIHLHVANNGMQIGYLTRRLLSRLKRAARSAGKDPELAVMGLSATIAEPKSFFRKLTSLPEEDIDVIVPEEAELRRHGSEYFIFVKANPEERVGAMSTMLQTNMVLMHSMPQRPDGSHYLGLGFADSHDLVGRWDKQFRDADGRQKLFLLRDMSDQGNRERTAQYFRRTASECRGCADHPNLDCVMFREGECWWSMSHAGNANKEPLKVGTETAKRIARPEDYRDNDQLIATSRLEVGFDDDRIMAVMQYQAPGNAASFIQRKGRGGRSYGTYPITVMVLNPYRPQDAFYFKNAHLLTSPVFRELPLNPGNTLVQRVHGFYAMFEQWISKASASGQNLSFGYMRVDTADRIRAWTSTEQDFDELLLAVQDALQVTAKEALTILADEQIGVVSSGLKLLFNELQSSINQGKTHVSGADLLSSFLPRNFFTDINLPQLDIKPGAGFDPHVSNPLDTLDLAPGIRAVLPGKVSWRGKDPFWVPPKLDFRAGLIGVHRQYVLDENWDVTPLPDKFARAKIPLRLKERLSVQDGYELAVYRPRSVVVQPCMPQVGQEQVRQYSRWYLENERDDGSPLRDVTLAKAKATLDERSVAHGLAFDTVNFPQQDMKANMAWKASGHTNPATLGLYGEKLIHQIRLADHRDQPMRVHRLTMGGDINLQWPGGKGYAETYAFMRDEKLCLLGYELSTEGMAFDLPKQVPLLPHIDGGRDSARKGPVWQRQLFEFQAKLAFQKAGMNIFTADRLLRAFLSVWAQKSPEERHTQNIPRVLEGNEWREDIKVTLEKVYRTHEETQDEIMAMLDLSETRKLLEEAWRLSLKDSERNNWSWDVEMFTLSHAILQAAQQHAGVEAGQQLSVNVPLRVDYGLTTQPALYLFEDGVGGLGIARSLHDQFREWPLAFWDLVEHKLQHCPVGDEEDLLLAVLKLDENRLDALASACLAVHDANGLHATRHQLQHLKAVARTELGLDLMPAMTKALLRVFAPITRAWAGQGVETWKLYREINVVLPDAYEAEHGVRPNEAELTTLAGTWIASHDERIPSLTALNNLLTADQDEQWEKHAEAVKASAGKPAVRQLFEQFPTMADATALKQLGAEERQEKLRREYRVKFSPDPTRDAALLKQFDESYFDAEDRLYWIESCWAFVHGQLAEQKGPYLMQLNRAALQREIARRLLNSCVLACPNCLASNAVNMADRALLDRRATMKAMIDMRKNLDIEVKDDMTVESLTERASQVLRDGARRCVFVFELSVQRVVSQAVAKLAGQGIRQEIGEYGVIVARTGLRALRLPQHKPQYELHLELKELH